MDSSLNNNYASQSKFSPQQRKSFDPNQHASLAGRRHANPCYKESAYCQRKYYLFIIKETVIQMARMSVICQ